MCFDLVACVFLHLLPRVVLFFSFLSFSPFARFCVKSTFKLFSCPFRILILLLPSLLLPHWSVNLMSFVLSFLIFLQTTGNIHNFCEVGLKIAGVVPIYSPPALVYGSTLLTSVAVTVTEQHTVAFLATSDGHLKKVRAIYETFCFACSLPLSQEQEVPLLPPLLLLIVLFVCLFFFKLLFGSDYRFSLIHSPFSYVA